MKNPGNRLFAIAVMAAILMCWHSSASAVIRVCGPFYLKDIQGNIINPLNGENGDHTLSTRQTCGTCHDYEHITKAYHFQQGWDRIRDDFNPDKPWMLSDGMMGKH